MGWQCQLKCTIFSQLWVTECKHSTGYYWGGCTRRLQVKYYFVSFYIVCCEPSLKCWCLREVTHNLKNGKFSSWQFHVLVVLFNHQSKINTKLREVLWVWLFVFLKTFANFYMAETLRLIQYSHYALICSFFLMDGCDFFLSKLNFIYSLKSKC